MDKLIFVILIIFSHAIYGQEKYQNLIIGKEEEVELSFQKYDSLIIKKEYTKLEDVSNNTPENLLKSILSATSQEWVDYNTLGGNLKSTKRNADYFKKIEQMNKDKNYIQLVHKVTFLIDNVPTEIIKFYFKQENAEQTSGCYVLQKINNRWYKVSNSTTANLSIMIMRLKTEILVELFSGKFSNPKIREVYNMIYSNKILDLRKFEKIFFSWYSPTKNNDILNLFIDSKTW
jgi:hypothetical protein